jgi:hypothetical protein
MRVRRGDYVAVVLHPQWPDPLHRPGHTGKVTSASSMQISVKFDDGRERRYDPGCVVKCRFARGAANLSLEPGIPVVLRKDVRVGPATAAAGTPGACRLASCTRPLEQGEGRSQPFFSRTRIAARLGKTLLSAHPRPCPDALRVATPRPTALLAPKRPVRRSMRSDNALCAATTGRERGAS